MRTIRREVKACRACGYSRKVIISVWLMGGGKSEEWWAKDCTACDLMRSVRVHRATADRLEAKAHAIYAKRSTR